MPQHVSMNGNYVLDSTYGELTRLLGSYGRASNVFDLIVASPKALQVACMLSCNIAVDRNHSSNVARLQFADPAVTEMQGIGGSSLTGTMLSINKYPTQNDLECQSHWSIFNFFCCNPLLGACAYLQIMTARDGRTEKAKVLSSYNCAKILNLASAVVGSIAVLAVVLLLALGVVP